jgi:S-disulfanyl-L-cysteine oxidoreductase SoxD
MGAYPMRCSRSSLNVLVPALILLAAPAVGLAQSPTYKVGTPLGQEEIRGFDFMIGPEGKELPAGRGTAKEGAEIFAKRCSVCHGPNGEGGVVRRLVVGSPGRPH